MTVNHPLSNPQQSIHESQSKNPLVTVLNDREDDNIVEKYNEMINHPTINSNNHSFLSNIDTTSALSQLSNSCNMAFSPSLTSVDNATNMYNSAAIALHNIHSSIPSQNIDNPPIINTSLSNTSVVLPAFLTKTFEIFSTQEYYDICSWNEEGDTIIIKKPGEFTDSILPKYFKHQNFPSFIRQLNMYGFHKSVLDSNRREFQHPNFRRGRKDLLQLIKRKTNVSASTPTNACMNSLSGSIMGGINNNIMGRNSRDTQLDNNAFRKYDVHRDNSDIILEELRSIRQRSEALETRLRHVELDTAIVRNENSKLWSQLDASKQRQILMQNKMKKILWVLFELFRLRASSTVGNGANKNTLTSSYSSSSQEVSDEFANTSRLGSADFREILRYLDMDEPPLLKGENDIVQKQDNNNSIVERIKNEVDLQTNLKKRKIADSIPLAIVEKIFSSDLDNTRKQITADIHSVTDDCSSNVSETPGNRIEQYASPKTLSSEYPISSRSPLSISSSNVGSPENKATNTTALSIFTPPLSEKYIKCLPASTRTPQRTSQSEERPLTEIAFQNKETEENVMQKLEEFETQLLDDYDADTLDSLLENLETNKERNTRKEHSIHVK